MDDLDKLILILTARSMEDLEKILELPNVKGIHLNFSKSSQSPVGIKNIPTEQLCKLLEKAGDLIRSLDMSNTSISDQDLAQFTMQLNKLRDLTLAGCCKLTDAGIHVLLSVCGPNLKTLYLYGTGVTGENPAGLTEQLNNIETLNLGFCSQLTDAGLRELLRICGQKLERLRLRNTHITLGVLADRIEQQPLVQLRRLDLSYCDNVTRADIQRMNEMLPNCYIVS